MVWRFAGDPHSRAWRQADDGPVCRRGRPWRRGSAGGLPPAAPGADGIHWKS